MCEAVNRKKTTQGFKIFQQPERKPEDRKKNVFGLQMLKLKRKLNALTQKNKD
jgi:hypothetical protein